jgi:hypothetical protein
MGVSRLCQQVEKCDLREVWIGQLDQIPGYSKYLVRCRMAPGDVLSV